MIRDSNITPDWSSRVQIEDQNIVLHTNNTDRPPLVTVGIPTFKRHQTLQRALASMARQTFRDFALIVSDNAGVNQETIDTIRSFEKDLPEVYLVAQSSNLGALGNLSFLLSCATTEYFMWLADDDEVSENYLEELFSLLESDAAAVCAMGNWCMMQSPEKGVNRKQLKNTAASRLARVSKFIALEADDSFFYGLHRTESLRKCYFDGYFFPNSQIITNCCHVFLFDLIWQGPVRYSSDATWICHNYSDKSYNCAEARGIGDKLKTLIRRLNVYFLYCKKNLAKEPLTFLATVPLSVFGFVRDIVYAVVRVARRAVGL